MSLDIEFRRPTNFPYEEVFYWDGSSAMILGTYKDSPNRSLGLRWMVAEGSLGFPSTFGREMWMVVPDKLALYLLEGISNNREQEAEAILRPDLLEDALAEIRANNG